MNKLASLLTIPMVVGCTTVEPYNPRDRAINYGISTGTAIAARESMRQQMYISARIRCHDERHVATQIYSVAKTSPDKGVLIQSFGYNREITSIMDRAILVVTDESETETEFADFYYNRCITSAEKFYGDPKRWQEMLQGEYSFKPLDLDI